MPTNLPDKLTTPSTVVCQSPDCDVDTDFCDHPKIDVDKQNMQDDIELLTTFADGAGDGALPWNNQGECIPKGTPTFKSLVAWLGMQFTQIYCALQNIYNKICSILQDIENLKNTIWESCKLRPTTIPFSVNGGRYDLDINSIQVIGQVTIPDIGCPYKAEINMGTYVDQVPHTNGGDPYHLNVQICLDSPTSPIIYGDQWHGDSVFDNPSDGWNDSTAVSTEIYLSGSHTLYFVVESDIAPVWGTANNVYAQATGVITLFRQ